MCGIAFEQLAKDWDRAIIVANRIVSQSKIIGSATPVGWAVRLSLSEASASLYLACRKYTAPIAYVSPAS